MRQQLAKLIFLLFLCIFLVGGEAHLRNSGRSDVSSCELKESRGPLQRRMLQDQHTPISAESKREKVQESVKHGQQNKLKSKAEEKTGWIKDTKTDAVNLSQEPKVGKDQTKVQVKIKREEWKETKLEGKKGKPTVVERKEDFIVVKPIKSMKVKFEDEERNESVAEDRNGEPIRGSKKEVTKVEKSLELNLGDRMVEELEVRLEPMPRGNDERKVEDKGEVGKDGTLKVQDKKEKKIQVGVKYEGQEREEEHSTASEIVEDKPIGAHEIEDDLHSDLDQDYPDFLDELRNFPERIQKTAVSVQDHIRYSGLDKYSSHSKELFSRANQQIQESFVPLLGKDYAPVLAYLVSYGLLLLPLALVTYLFDKIRARYSLQKILFFVNIYLSAYFAILLGVTLVLDREIMSFFMKYSSTSYIFLQLLQGFGYVVYLLLNTADLITTCSNRNLAVQFSCLLQCVVVVAVGFHYYVTVFHRAMARKAPLTGWKIYGLYSVTFVFLCLFARIEWGKKHYIAVEVDDTTDKKN